MNPRLFLCRKELTWRCACKYQVRLAQFWLFFFHSHYTIHPIWCTSFPVEFNVFTSLQLTAQTATSTTGLYPLMVWTLIIHAKWTGFKHNEYVREVLSTKVINTWCRAGSFVVASLSSPSHPSCWSLCCLSKLQRCCEINGTNAGSVPSQKKNDDGWWMFG